VPFTGLKKDLLIHDNLTGRQTVCGKWSVVQQLEWGLIILRKFKIEMINESVWADGLNNVFDGLFTGFMSPEIYLRSFTQSP
jgi:hypothetical protein